MKDKKTIVIITDDSSRNTSAAIKEYFKEENDILTIIIAENELQSYLRLSLFNYFFKEESKMRNVYDKVKELRKAKNMDRLPSKKVEFFSKNPVYKRMANVFLRYTPDIVIPLTPTVLMPVLATRDKLGMKTKIAVIIDEFCLDKQMIHRAVDYYFVDNYDIKEGLINNNISEDKIQINNIPVRKNIQKEISREDALKVFDYKDKPTLLFVASQYGDEKFRKLITDINDKNFDINVIVACGYNRKLLNFVREKTSFLGLNEGIDMNAALTIADIVIARPTATILAEALFKKKLIYSIFPSGEMEKRTHNYLGLDLLVKLDNSNDLIEKVNEYLENKDNFEGIMRIVNCAVEGNPVEKIGKKINDMF